MRGWHNESYKHYLASQGILTKCVRGKYLALFSKSLRGNKPMMVKKQSQIIMESLEPFVKRIDVAGSIRRGKEPNDIDFVIIPKASQKDLFGNDVQGYIPEDIHKFMKQKYNAKLISSGPKKMTYDVDGTKVEFNIASEENYGAMMLTTTGNAEFNRRMRRIAMSKKMMLNQYGLWERIKGKNGEDDTKGKLIASKTEEEIFKALGQKYIEPRYRSIDIQVRE